MTNPRTTSAPITRSLLRIRLSADEARWALAAMLRVTWMEILALERIAAAGRLPPARLGDQLEMSSGGVTALVQGLERLGYLMRCPNPADRRSVLVRLTPQVGDRLEAATAPLLDGIEAATTGLEPAERLRIQGYLEQIVWLSESHMQELRRSVDARRGTDITPEPPPLWA